MACGDRPPSKESAVGAVTVVAIDRRVAIVDRGENRVLLLAPHADKELDRTFVPVGHNVQSVQVSPDQKRLLVLAAGDTPRQKPDDERPSLTVIDADGSRRYTLESAHSGLAVDPAGRWIAVFANPAPQAGAPTSFVENPNEILLVDQNAASVDDAITTRTLRSFGGRPQRLTFAPTLTLPNGPRHLLVVETEEDLSILDLDHATDSPPRPEITVRLSSGGGAAALAPAQVVFDDGDPAKNDDARVGVRVASGSNVVTLTLGASSGGAPNDFVPTLNLTDVGGVAGDLAFVRTVAGPRLAAVVPSTRAAVLIDPVTSITAQVDLPDAYSKIALVTASGAAGSGDVALLYGGTTAEAAIAFWSLGKTTEMASRSLDVLGLAATVSSVVDLPAPHPDLKVLRAGANANAFYVLSLTSRTASLLATRGSPTLHVAPDGERLWPFLPGTPELAQVSLATLHPVELPLQSPIDAAFEVATPEGNSVLVAIDTHGAVGATVLDADQPDPTSTRAYHGLLLEGL
jgi:hypothetical protein